MISQISSKNTQQDEILHLGLDYDICNGWLCDFNKSLLTMTDEQINKIVEYDRTEKEAKRKQQEAAAKARQERKKQQAEKAEYEQYLKLKKKFEKESV